MADDGSFNSMQAQLGLVGQGGSFNPLGIATPPPPAPPMVRHPGEVSQDIVRQTQTQMATTLQTTSAMRLGGMGGIAFGGGGGGGGGMGAIGAFAQQYQQNMIGINAQHVSPFSAQMMGQMGGMGGGFQPGMMPHPAMMTPPGMGIYRPFMPQQGPTVSPFPQMPMFQTPLTPMPPPPQFQTPMELSNNMAIQAGHRRTAAMFATPGVAARAGTDVGLGYMGAAAGAALGSHFGPMGAAIGGTLGMAAGAFGSEHFGLGATAQHITDRMNPFRTMAIRGQQLQAGSQDWVSGGSNLNMMTGRGLSSQGATHLGRMLEDTAFSSTFRKQTGGAFSAQDLTKITNVAGQQGMLNDAQSVDQIHDRVKSVAKSLVSFMKIANEPNVVEALKSMGKMRAMGMSLSETMDMAVDARMYSKMAGTSARGLMESGGMPGAMMFQQQGLSAGLGMRMGMGAMGMAGAAVSGGAFTPQRLAMLGGVQGVAQHEMESSAAFLKMPMMAAAMSRMGRGGEFTMDGGAVRSLGNGGMNINQMATSGVNNMLEAVHKQGIGALGMMQVQGTEIQDNLGRLLGPQGTQAAKMQQVMQTMKMMGLDKNPGGFATAGLAMGMSNDQVKSMMSQANSPGYFQGIQRHLAVQKMELRGLEGEEFERNRPGILGRMQERAGGFQALRDAHAGFRNMGEGISDFFSEREQVSQARGRGQVVLHTASSLLGTDATLRNARGMRHPGMAAAMMGDLGSQRGSGLGAGYRSARDAILGGDQDDLRQMRETQGGWAGLLGGGALEANYRGGMALLTGTSGGLGTEAENRATSKDLAAGAGMWKTAQREGADDWKKRLSSTAASSKIDEGKMRQLVASVQLKLADRANSNMGEGILKGGMMGGEEANSIIAAEASRMGLKLDKGALENVGVLAGKTAGELTNNKDAFRPRDIVNVKSDKLFKEGLLKGQDALSSAVFGHDEGLDLLRGTRNNRARILQKAFGEQKDAKAGVLASILSAAQYPGATDEDKRKAAEALGSADKEDVDRATALRTSLKDDLPELAKMGRKFLAVGGTLKEKYAGGEAIREGSLSVEQQGAQRSGRRALFGEGADLSSSTEELLASGKVGSMSGRMKDIAQRFREAKLAGKDTSAIVAEADEATTRSGVNIAAESAGGYASPSESAIEAERDRMSKTESDVSGAFPHAVDTFSEASRQMLRAAQMLGKGLDHTDMRNGNAPEGV